MCVGGISSVFIFFVYFQMPCLFSTLFTSFSSVLDLKKPMSRRHFKTVFLKRHYIILIFFFPRSGKEISSEGKKKKKIKFCTLQEKKNLLNLCQTCDTNPILYMLQASVKLGNEREFSLKEIQAR